MNTPYHAPYTPVEETRLNNETTKKVDALRKSLGGLGELALAHVVRKWDDYQPTRRVEEGMNNA